MTQQKMNRPSRTELAKIRFDFRKRDDGRWERRAVGGSEWKSLRVEHGQLTKRQQQAADRQRDRVAANGQAATSVNEWTWL